MPLVDSLSPRRRSGERVSERGFQLVGPIRWNLPLSPALSPLVPRRERGRGPSTMVVAEMRRTNRVRPFSLLPLVGIFSTWPFLQTYTGCAEVSRLIAVQFCETGSVGRAMRKEIFFGQRDIVLLFTISLALYPLCSCRTV